MTSIRRTAPQSISLCFAFFVTTQSAYAQGDNISATSNLLDDAERVAEAISISEASGLIRPTIATGLISTGTKAATIVDALSSGRTEEGVAAAASAPTQSRLIKVAADFGQFVGRVDRRGRVVMAALGGATGLFLGKELVEEPFVELLTQGSNVLRDSRSPAVANLDVKESIGSQITERSGRESPTARRTNPFEDPPPRIHTRGDDGGFGDMFSRITPEALTDPVTEGADDTQNDNRCAELYPEVASMIPAEQEEFCNEVAAACPELTPEERQSILDSSEFHQAQSQRIEEEIERLQTMLNPITQCMESGFIQPFCGREDDYNYLNSSIADFQDELQDLEARSLRQHCDDQRLARQNHGVVDAQ